MPRVFHSQYPGPPWYQINGHAQTIMPAFKRWSLSYARERLELPDGDFLDLDWLRQPTSSTRLVILTHGLEGNSQRPYIQSAAHFFHTKGWDALAWNCRSCSEEMNRLPRLYHHGEIEDLGQVVEHALRDGQYAEVVLLGYSMGGSMNTKYLSVKADAVPEPVKGGVAFSSPFDLAASVDALEWPGNGVYKRRFLEQLSRKIKSIDSRFPGRIAPKKLAQVDRWRDFDEWFTAPLLGLASAEDFYALASAKNFLPGLRHPVLLVNALNDPIIPLECSPISFAEQSEQLFLELPQQGGHVGFTLSRNTWNWMDYRAHEFIEEVIRGRKAEGGGRK